MNTKSVLNTPLAVTDYRGLAEFLFLRAKEDAAYVVDFSNTHIVTMRRHDPDFFRMTSCVDLFVPDGMPLVWAMNRTGAGMSDRVYGPTFMRRCLEGCDGDVGHYFVGGSPECGIALQRVFQEVNAKFHWVGSYHGRCSLDGVLEEDEAVLAEITEKKPAMIWVGLGTPKQYAWIQRMKERLDRGVFLAVGFAFDVNAGTKSDAPLWMQRRGLTWLYRMASEPRRLVGRYGKWNSLFLWYYLTGKGWRKSKNEK